MMESKNKIFRKDYSRPEYQITHTQLNFYFNSDHCLVTAKLKFKKEDAAANSNPLFLNGEGLELIKIEVNQRPLSDDDYHITPLGLTLNTPPNEFELHTQVKIYPKNNTSLEGLYWSEDHFITQCEPEGFRKITYYLDRPDVMSLYEVCINAPTDFQYLLSNGEKKEETIIEGRRICLWKDHFKKPCYLFALVVGNFEVLEDSFSSSLNESTTKLKLYVPPAKKSQAKHACLSLKKAMLWDEQRFGLAYDLSEYMIVATDNFNGGAMENKGLNVFNSRLIMVDPQSSTDYDAFLVESVIAHEYFHNWSGNRVTLRDWFNLSLKEGLTVFRDQEFSMDMWSNHQVRIDSVKNLRNRQFAEDSGPNAHPVYPESCYAVDNFFTPTIYEKGAEVIRMMQTIVGRPFFNKALRKYFELYDGQAVTIEDFAALILDYPPLKENPQFDFDQFKLWYSQAGTPDVQIIEHFDSESGQYRIELQQLLPKFEHLNQHTPQPLIIPLVFALYDQAGHPINLSTNSVYTNSENQTILLLSHQKESLILGEFAQQPLLSINQGFSAPIRLTRPQISWVEQLKLLQVEHDGFNQWDAIQSIYLELFGQAVKNPNRSPSILPSELLTFLKNSFTASNRDPLLLASLLTLPSLNYITQSLKTFSAPLYASIRHQIYLELAHGLNSELTPYLTSQTPFNEFAFNKEQMGYRNLQERAVFLMSHISTYHPVIFELLKTASNMSLQQAAFAASITNADFREPAKNYFYQKWQINSLTLNKWFSSLASYTHQNLFAEIKELWEHPSFNKTNPNRVFSLLGSWGQNITHFYQNKDHQQWFLQRLLEIDSINAQTAARLASQLNFLIYLDADYQNELKTLLQESLTKTMSPNLFEVLSQIEESLATNLT